MKLATHSALFLGLLATACLADHHGGEKEFVELFNGQDLTGWKVSEHPDSFSVQDGELVAVGPRAHLFYVGDVHGAVWKDFEVKMKVLTKPNANAGFYFHTEWQEEGWPAKGYEAQINATHKDPKKTGSIYAVVNVMDHAPHKDNEWFDYHIKVQGKTITLSINGELTATYTEQPGVVPNAKMPGRMLSEGTIAIQCHDPGSEARFKSIKIRPLSRHTPESLRPRAMALSNKHFVRLLEYLKSFDNLLIQGA
ncbi:MAG: DUF1080 domain-containing protein [Verrucomicrobiota bacterium]